MVTKKKYDGYLKYSKNNESELINYYLTNNKNIYLKLNKEQEIVAYVPRKYMNTIILDNFLKSSVPKLLEIKTKIEQKKILAINIEKNKFYLWGKESKFLIQKNILNLFELNKNLKILKQGAEFTLNKYLKKILLELSTSYVEKFCKLLCIPSESIKVRILKKNNAWGTNHFLKRTITFSDRLIFYRKEVLEYVACHEVVHFIYQNHSVEFWNVVKKYIPNFKQIKKELKDKIFI
ncbi:hypothetical protein C1937_00535 [Metamycoplasma hominis]|uniref:YgjP-like metallopeptidase domain-containing protein n=1 Tax=Metamycoplasma hominis TaxID=2098 RepID=UPI000CD6B464|nr:YgjP-like metallopeptidase domain-containing protein [Metamycoplasma hominis]AUW36949.1 hypothetical protein C1937_00535 [Metamycoplasma hominis]